MTNETDIATDLAEGIRRVAARAASEEDLRIGVESLLREALQALGIDVEPRYEKTYAQSGSVLSGRSDAVYGHLVIEYERPGALHRRGGLAHAADQLDRYIDAELAAEAVANTPQTVPQRIAGVGLDGHQIFFLRYRPGSPRRPLPEVAPYQPALPLFPDLGGATEHEPESRYQVLGPYEVTAESIRTFLLYLRSLRRRSLTPEGLANEFGPGGDVARRLVSHLYRTVRASPSPTVATFFAEWDRLFGIVYGQEPERAKRAATELSSNFELDSDAQLKPLLFAVHTYYALLMKLLAGELASLQGGSFGASMAGDLSNADDSTILERLEDLENGGWFARLGIRNFLEGDFFGWYLAGWDAELAESTRSLARSLADFEPATGSLEPTATRDLLKRLYQYLVPRGLRRDLGEFYTPDWLAELTIEESGYAGDLETRLLDPACGSGTFLVLAVRRAREHAEEHLIDPQDTIRSILNNIVGFDLNPLAVIAARTNYLLALGTLVRYHAPLEIPVYLADSVLTPSSSRAQGEQLVGDYVIPSTVGAFTVPRTLASASQLATATRLLEHCTRLDYEEEEFLDRAQREFPDLDEVGLGGLTNLFLKIRSLERDGRDGLWARIIKNAFAPLFAGQFDYVVGNPPWVRWGYLSDSYRAATASLWVDFGLFSLSGLASRLGGGEKDFSKLFLYVCADAYLKDGGTLAFVITQEVVKGKGAGRGFRRFKIGVDGPALGVKLAHDLVDIKPFEGAGNKTGMLILSKGARTEYPVPYVLWTRLPGIGRIEPGQSLDRVRELTARTDEVARPVGSDMLNPWMTAPADRIDQLARVGGSSDYRARRGASMDPYGVFWLDLLGVRPDGALLVKNLPELGERPIPKVEAAVEPDLVFPGVRGADLSRWAVRPHHYVIVAQDPAKREGFPESRMRSEWPLTYSYLHRFRDVLLSRGSKVVAELAAETSPWTTYGVGPYTFAPHRVTWKRMASDLVATVLSQVDTPFGLKAPIGTDTTSYIPCDSEDEAHYICALLNSTLCRSYVQSFSSGGRGFGAPSIVGEIRLPRYSDTESTHLQLADLSRRAHTISASAEQTGNLAEIEADVDAVAAELWGI